MPENRPILITGCQRSGTTLLHLILDSHPDVTTLDEDAFDALRLPHFLSHPDYHPNVAFKLPTVSHEVACFSELSRLKVLWCLRDPRDVLASMITLQMPLPPSQVCWAVHPHAAPIEILQCAKVLGCTFHPKRMGWLRAFLQIQRKPPHKQSREDAVFCAALCWRLKHELLDLYDRLNIDYTIVRYEELILDPEATLRSLLGFLDLPWHDDLLRHHQLHEGIAIGETNRARPIDATSLGKWQKQLLPSDIELLRNLCDDLPEKLGYDLSSIPISPFSAGGSL